MKKFAIILVTAFLSFAALTSQATAAVPTNIRAANVVHNTEAERVKTLESRLYEIKAMDKSKLKASDKKQLRKEVKSINRNIHDIGGGYYISAGAIVVVLVLLLVLL
jgi:hypothetical protein